MVFIISLLNKLHKIKLSIIENLDYDIKNKALSNII